MLPVVANDQRQSTNDHRPIYPIPSSSEDSSGVPHRRQITAEQSPQVRGSLTSTDQNGQYNTTVGLRSSGNRFDRNYYIIKHEYKNVTHCTHSLSHPILPPT